MTFLISNSFRFDLTWLKYRWHRCTCGLIALAILCNGHDVTWLGSVHDLTCLSTKSTHKAATKDTTRPTERLQSWLCFILRIILVWRLYQLTIYTHMESPTHKKLFIEKKVVNFTVIHSFSINISQGHSGNCLVLPKRGRNCYEIGQKVAETPGRGRAFFVLSLSCLPLLQGDNCWFASFSSIIKWLLDCLWV